MATPFEYMQADMAWTFEQAGESVVDVVLTVAGDIQRQIRATKRILAADQSRYDGAPMERVELGFIHGAPPEPLPGRKAVLDGVGYEIESWTPGTLVDLLILARFIP